MIEIGYGFNIKDINKIKKYKNIKILLWIFLKIN